MKNKVQKFIFFLIIIITSNEIYAFKHNEKIQFTIKNNNLNFVIASENRFKSDDIYYRQYEIGINYPFNFLIEDLNLNFNLKYAYTKSNNSWSLEKRPHIQISKVFSMPNTYIELRTRHEYRLKSDNQETARNRMRIKVTSKNKVFNMNPFVSNELYYDFDEKELTTNRLEVGASFLLKNETETSFYYKLVTDLDDSGWGHNHSLTLTISF